MIASGGGAAAQRTADPAAGASAAAALERFTSPPLPRFTGEEAFQRYVDAFDNADFYGALRRPIRSA